MTVPTGGYAQRSRAAGQRKGWALPLDWDDIDHGDAPAAAHGEVLDELLIERVVRGEHALIRQATPAERRAVVAHFRRVGLPLAPLERAGIKPDRYTEEDAA